MGDFRSITNIWRLLSGFISIALTLIFVLFSFFPTWLLLGNTLSQFAIAAPAPSAEVGTIPGEFAVNGNGGATYTVPIEVPPGINGVQPNLSLVYNSQQGNGLLGVGWQLAGLSAIARCGKTIATDGIRGGVNFDSGDRFCFDGQRLMAVSGNYGEDGTEYHTERETWVKVISHTESDQNGPRSFTVTTKDGHEMEFGNTDDSRILARGRSDEAVIVWALNKISDRNGNFVEVSYQEDTSRVERSISGAFLGYYPTEIRYTGNSGVTPLRLVKFEYEDRSDNITAYVGGSEAETPKRLAGIKTYVDLDGDGNSIETDSNLVKEYGLAYEYGTATERSRLIQLEECDAVGVCLPETEFEWQIGTGESGFNEGVNFNSSEGSGNLALLPMDVNGDGMTDLVQPWKNNKKLSILTYFSNGNGFKEGVNFDSSQASDNLALLSMDVNGDGMTDLVQPWENNKKLSIFTYLSNGNGFNEGVNFNSSQGSGNLALLPMDVNGDGMTDLVQPWENNKKLSILTYLSNSNGFNEGVNFNSSQGSGNLALLPMDVNGDGMTDLVQPWKNNKKLSILTYLSNGNGFNEGVNFNSSQGSGNLALLPMDVNGDGMTDLVQPWENNKKLSILTYLSNSNGFNEGVNFNSSQGSGNLALLPMDVNGDGMTDLVQPWKNNKKLSILTYLSNGNGFNEGVNFNSSQGSGNLALLPMDVNGDGMTDLVQPWKNNKKLSILTYLAKNSNQDLLFTITNGLGGQTQIDYKPLTDSTVYTKEVTETENNGNANSANGLGSTDVVVRGDISSSSDEDWFTFDIPSSREITISMAIDNDDDLDLFLYEESYLSTPVVKEGYSTNNSEEGTYNATNSGRYYLKVNGYNGATSPYTLTLYSSDSIVTVQNTMYMVSQHTISDRASNPTNTFVYDHKYEGAKIDRYRGWLGFEKTILIDNQNETQTITTHHTDFPLLGMIDDREIWDLENPGNFLGKMASSYESSPKDSNGIYKFWKTALTLEHYTEGTYNYTLQRTYEYDNNYQNVTVTSDLGDVTDSDDDVYTCIDYESGTGADWWKSFYPSQQKIVNSAAGCNDFSNWDASTDLRWEQFGYDSQMNLTSHSNWQDKSSPDDTSGKWLTTTTTYDIYGNVTALTDTLGNTSNTTYESTYHTFPEKRATPSASTSSQSLTVSTSYEPKFGIKTQVVDPNGHISMNIADSGIDGFGRVLEIQGIKPDSNDLVTLNKTEFLDATSGMSVKTSYRTEWNGSNTPDDTWLWDREYIDGLGKNDNQKSRI